MRWTNSHAEYYCRWDWHYIVEENWVFGVQNETTALTQGQPQTRKKLEKAKDVVSTSRSSYVGTVNC